MADRQHDKLDHQASEIARDLDRGEGLKAVDAMRKAMQDMSPADFSRLIKAVDKRDNKALGDNIEIVDTRDEKIIIMSGKKGEALVGSMH